MILSGMRPVISIITLAVEDLQLSLQFYRDGLGLPTRGMVESFDDHVVFEMQQGLSLAIYLKSEMEKITGEKVIGSSTILSYAAQNAGEVDSIIKQAVDAGATLCGEAKKEAWGYMAYFKDPDGHVWEVMCGPEVNS